jgi:hypothetical protein
MSRASGLTECPNCGTHLAGAYCTTCGQKNTAINPTFGDFLHDLSHEFLNVDSKIFRTLWLLFARPGFLTHEYFLGRRARYGSAIRLYLIFSILFFATLAFAPDLIRVNFTYTPDEGEIADPARIEQMQQAAVDAVNEVTNTWVPRLMFVMVPIFAALVMLVRRKTGRNYPQHMVFALHVHSVWFFAAAVVAGWHLARVPIPNGEVVVKWAALLYAASYFVRAFRRAYEVTRWSSIWRTAVVSLLYFLILMPTLITLWLSAGLAAARNP